MQPFDIALNFLRSHLLEIDAAGPCGFEGLIADCLASLSGLVIRLAKSGSQFGRDATSPFAAFAIAIEAKRYSTSPRLEDVAGKAVLGGSALNESVDVWILGCTSEVGEATVRDLKTILDGYGMTLLTLDWTPRPLPPLAVLLAAAKSATLDWFRRCAPAVNRDELEAHLNVVSSHEAYEMLAQSIRGDLQSARVGLDALRRRSSEWVNIRLTDRGESQLSFGQFLSRAEPGARPYPRNGLITALAQAISTNPPNGVVAVIGEEGTGKTWLIPQWWAATSVPPILLFVAGRRTEKLIPDDALESLSRLLAEQEGGIDESALRAWRRRLQRWQQFDAKGEIRFVLVLDGLNEHPERPWADIIKSHSKLVAALGGVTIVTSRAGFWRRDILARLPEFYSVPTVEASGYSDEELAGVLADANTNLSDLPDKMREFLRNPRVCSVALGLLDRLKVQPSELTIERLLLEYWQARLRERGDLLAHGTADFNRLLQAHARDFRDNSKRTFDRDDWISYSGVAKRRGIESVQNDLTEVEEGRFLEISPNDPNAYEFRSEVLPFALGLLINDELRRAFTSDSKASLPSPDDLIGRLLEPVRGFDAIADIVAAAVGLSCLEEAFPETAREALIRAYCGLQNTRQTAFESMAAYVPICPDAFLNVVESAQSLRTLNNPELVPSLLVTARDHPKVASAFKRRMPRWLAGWSRQSTVVFPGNESNQKQRADDRDARLRENFESLSAAELALFQELTVAVDQPSGQQLDRIAAVLLAARPLAPHASALLGWALVQGLARDYHNAYEELGWVLRLNQIDPRETLQAVTALIAEVGSSSSAPVRASAAILLRLFGDAVSAARADELNPLDPPQRWRRVERFCDTNPHDPMAEAGSNITNAQTALAEIDPQHIWTSMGQTVEDMNVEAVTPALARFDVGTAVQFLRRAVLTAPTRTGFPLRQLAWHLTELSPLFQAPELEAISKAHRLLLGDPTLVDAHDLYWVHSNLVCAQVPHLSAREQLDLILALPSGIPLFNNMLSGLKPLSADELERLVTEAEDGKDEERLKRIFFFAAGSRSELTTKSRNSVAAAMSSENEQLSIIAAVAAYHLDEPQLAAEILDRARASPWKGLSLDGSFFHRRAVAAAVLRLNPPDAFELIHPEFLSVVTDRLGPKAAERLSDITERALLRVLKSVRAQPKISLDPYARISSDGFDRRSWAEEVVDADAGADIEAWARDINDMEGGARRFAERTREMREELLAYEKALVDEGAAAIPAPFPVKALQAIINHNPGRARKWVELIIATDDERLLAQARNLGLGICGAYATHDGALAALALNKLRDARSIWNITVDGIGLYESALFAAGDVRELAPLREAVFRQAFDDRSIERATLAAEASGAKEWLSSFVETLVASPTVGERALGMTIAGYRAANGNSERVLERRWGPGFLETVAEFSRENYERDAWARHWMEAAVTASNPIDLWRFAKLAEGVVDSRFNLWLADFRPNAQWSLFAAEATKRLENAAEKRSKERGKSLFGRRAPDRDLVSALCDNA